MDNCSVGTRGGGEVLFRTLYEVILVSCLLGGIGVLEFDSVCTTG